MLFRVSQKLVTHQIVNSTEVLQWLGEVLTLRNRFLNKYKDHATVDANIPRTRDAQNKLEVGCWNIIVIYVYIPLVGGRQWLLHSVYLPMNRRCKRGQHQKNPIGFVQSKYLMSVSQQQS